METKKFWVIFGRTSFQTWLNFAQVSQVLKQFQLPENGLFTSVPFLNNKFANKSLLH
jgi:hypothetical protein